MFDPRRRSLGFIGSWQCLVTLRISRDDQICRCVAPVLVGPNRSDGDNYRGYRSSPENGPAPPAAESNYGSCGFEGLRRRKRQRDNVAAVTAARKVLRHNRPFRRWQRTLGKSCQDVSVGMQGRRG
jgi:hypothetical protein